ncbi:MAG: hypothetical protein H0V71_09520 [Chloroflexi bacterium]|nr:hypothetical protein [Chloroflexota bacterium]
MQVSDATLRRVLGDACGLCVLGHRLARARHRDGLPLALAAGLRRRIPGRVPPMLTVHALVPCIEVVSDTVRPAHASVWLH